MIKKVTIKFFKRFKNQTFDLRDKTGVGSPVPAEQETEGVCCT